MARFPQKTSLPTAVTHSSKLDLSCSHVTTSDFMELTVAKTLELVPHQSINFNMRTFARLDPMELPTFGDARVNNRAYFVPYRTIMPSWNDFINDTPHSYDDGSVGIPQSVPTIGNREFVMAFLSDIHDLYNSTDYVDSSTKTTTLSDFPNRDIVVNPEAGDPYGINFTRKGKQIFKLINQLGYRIDFNLKNTDFRSSALPLLSLLRVYVDYYYPSQYAQSEQIHRAIRLFTDNSNPANNPVISDHFRIRECFKIIESVCYDSDYFTSAWDSPDSPNAGAFSSTVIRDIDNIVDGDMSADVVLEDGIYGTAPYLKQQNGQPLNKISQYALNALRSLTDYMQRHKIVGARALDRYLSRWGITLSSEKLNRSVHIASMNEKIKFGDVTSTSSTDGASLGDYAGKGILDANSSFDFKTDEFGLFIVISTIVPKTSYYQGQDRNTMHITKLDFYTPEFDNLGTQAISTREIFCPHNSAEQYPNQTISNERYDYNSLIWGFTSRYAEYKVGRDNITGDYILGSRNTGKEAWTLFRDVRPFFKENGLDSTHELSFIIGSDSEQYNRIFYVTEGGDDHFNIIHKMEITSNFPGKKLFDTYEFYEEDKAQKVSVDTGGVKAN